MLIINLNPINDCIYIFDLFNSLYFSINQNKNLNITSLEFFKMKILAFTDIHASVKSLNILTKKIKKKHPDLLICVGDISIFGYGLKKTLKYINNLNIKIIIIHGNHEPEISTKKLCAFYTNITYIHKKFYLADKLLILGYGGGGFLIRDPYFKKLAKKFKKIISKNKDKKTILLLHAPPYGTKLDKISKNHYGNIDYLKFIKANNIDYVICGHFHENFGKTDKIKNTILLNPGPFGKIFKI